MSFKRFFFITLAVVILGGVAYEISTPLKPLSAAGTLSSSEPTAMDPDASSEIGNQFLNLLLNIKTIRLDDSILKAPTFSTLQDYSINLVQLGNEGRANPFAAIGRDKGKDQSAANSTPENISSDTTTSNSTTTSTGTTTTSDTNSGTTSTVPVKNTR